jgi:hypothetical protein
MCIWIRKSYTVSLCFTHAFAVSHWDVLVGELRVIANFDPYRFINPVHRMNRLT